MVITSGIYSKCYVNVLDVCVMPSHKQKRKLRQSGNAVKVSPENKKQKSLLEYFEDNPTEMATSKLEGTGVGDFAEFSEKLNTILEKIEPIRRIDANLSDLTTKFNALQSTVTAHDKRLLDIEKSATYLDSELDDVKAEIVNIKSSPVIPNKTVQLLTLKCEKLEESLLKQEIQGKKHNIIFDGIEEKEGEDCYEVIYNLLIKKMDIVDAAHRMRFAFIRRLGYKKKPKSYASSASTIHQKPRPIIAQVLNTLDKEEIMSRRNLLAPKPGIPASNINGSSQQTVWINHDLPDKVRQVKIILKAVLKLAIVKDKNAAIIGDKIRFNGTVYKVNQIGDMDLDISSLSMTSNGNAIYFYGRYTPLSNFYPVGISIDSFVFTSVEQYYQYKRALFCGERQLADEILLCDDPIDAKSLGNRLNLKDKEWYGPAADKTMKQALLHKFEIPQYKQFLKNTEEQLLVEANKFDMYFGIGLAPKDPKALDRNQWRGRNVLGQLLMQVRAEL